MGDRKRRTAKSERELKKFVRQLNSDVLDHNRTIAVTGELMQRLGGLHGFVAKFMAAFDVAEAAGAHSAVSSYLGAVVSLSVASNEFLAVNRNYEQMSDGDLKLAQQRSLVELVRANPQLAIWAASQLTDEWRLEPVGEIVTPMI